MTATVAAFGFRPAYNPSGQIRATQYNPGARAAAAAIYNGDPVKLVEDGTDFITIAAASDYIIGTFAGCEYNDVNGKPNVSSYWPGSVTGATNIVFYVFDNPDTVYESQAGGAIANSAVGDTADSVIAAGSTLTGLTGSYLSSTLKGGTTAGQWRIVGLGKGVDNAWSDAYTVVQCQIAQHQYRAVKGAV